MSRFPVQETKENQLFKRMQLLGIKEQDLVETFVRSGGRGGQNVNKVSTCVVLHHRPSGLIVKCQQARSQALNRFLARRILVEKLEKKVLGIKSAERQRFEKIRRQKRKRSKRAKMKMLDEKRRVGLKKELRKYLRPHKLEE